MERRIPAQGKDKTNPVQHDAVLLADIFNSFIIPSVSNSVNSAMFFHLAAQHVNMENEKSITTYIQLKGNLHERTAFATFGYQVGDTDINPNLPQDKQYLATARGWDHYKYKIHPFVFDVDTKSQEKFSQNRGTTRISAEKEYLAQMQLMRNILVNTRPNDLDLVFVEQSPDTAMMIWFYKTFLIKPLRQSEHVPPKSFHYTIPDSGSVFSGTCSDHACSVTFQCAHGDTVLKRTYAPVTKEGTSLAKKALGNVTLPFAIDKMVATEPFSTEQQAAYTQHLKDAQIFLATKVQQNQSAAFIFE